MRLIPPGQPLPERSLALANSDDVLALAETLRGLAAVLLHFPKWTDGRAYSQAVLLRGRLRFNGEIHATGDVLVDMLPLLRRCGFDAAQLRADQNPATAARMLSTLPGSPASAFPGHYQADPAPGRAARALAP